jgi:hypothetical protein
MGMDGHGVSLKIPDCTVIEKRLGGTLAASTGTAEGMPFVPT